MNYDQRDATAVLVNREYAGCYYYERYDYLDTWVACLPNGKTARLNSHSEAIGAIRAAYEWSKS